MTPERTLTQRELNRVLLAGQLLLDRAKGSIVDGRIVLEPFEELSKRDAAAVERERAELQRLHA
ncbi:MAG TPA: hypothetical protein VMQ65_07890 [Candidatus Limnocylindria bacterium]|nr:hypothetical protein [Candidatus Limnocylindria bacterium]